MFGVKLMVPRRSTFFFHSHARVANLVPQPIPNQFAFCLDQQDTHRKKARLICSVRHINIEAFGTRCSVIHVKRR